MIGSVTPIPLSYNFVCFRRNLKYFHHAELKNHTLLHQLSSNVIDKHMIHFLISAISFDLALVKDKF